MMSERKVDVRYSTELRFAAFAMEPIGYRSACPTEEKTRAAPVQRRGKIVFVPWR
jgi:hypothetical protein